MSIKILHTADWHIGKQLLKIDFARDMDLFFDWLITCIQENDIDLLLMSGDLFDQANPSQAAMTQYYGFLKRLLPLKCKVIVTGGNHDSPHVINAPKELLEILEIKVVGGIPEKIADLFVEVTVGNEKVVVAAVPFLRDKDIRNAVPGESYTDKIELIKDGILGYEDDKGYFITHDIYEEWALEKFINREFSKKENNQKFFKAIGQSLPIRRSFRNWVSEKLLLESEEIKNFIEEIISDTNSDQSWKNEILISILLSDYSDYFFKIFKIAY
jgi:hypothetical protein